MRSGIGAVLAFCVFPLGLAAQGPSIATVSLLQGVVGQAYNQILAAFGGTTPYTWAASGATPPGLSLGPDGIVAGVPTTAGVFSLTAVVTDGRLLTASKTFNIAIAASGAPLSITVATLPAATVGQSYTQTLQATGGVPPYRWSRGPNFPPFLALDPASGTLSGTPPAVAVFTVPVAVTDAVGVSATAALTLRILSGGVALAISTQPPIFAGAVGEPYSQVFGASGGTAPYKWSIASGSAGGLTVDPATGTLQGTPDRAGSFTFTLQVTDASGATATASYPLTVSAPRLVLTVGGSLPAGVAGTAYSQRLPATAGGGAPPYTWTVSPPAPAPGLSFNPADQSITGTPSAPGTFTFTVQVTDSAGATASRGIGLVINPAALSITTDRQLPDATLNAPYAATMAGAGGVPPYRWTANGLPPGVTIDPATGQISGTPSSGGLFPTAITIFDNALASVSDRFTINVKLPPAPQVTVSGFGASAAAADQIPVQVAISSPYPVPITGQATLTFTADNGPGDRTVQFASGGTNSSFSIPPGSTAAVSQAPLAVQTGTVAGTISIAVRLQAGGVDLTANPTVMTTRIDPSAPVIRDVQVTRAGGGLTVAISGYSTAREITRVTFTFKAAAGQTLQASAASIVIPVDTLFGPWFQNPANNQYGSQFVYTQPFTVQGDATAVLPDTVTVTNALGDATFKIAQ